MTENPTANPWRSPTYPQRTHIRERSQWEAMLKQWRMRVAEDAESLAMLTPGSPQLAERQKLHNQMLGALDQIADAARRMPMEVGELYEEDLHRLKEGVAALERLFARRR